MEVTKIVDEDIAAKVDTQYVEDQLARVQNVGLLYICTSEGGEEDEWTDDDSGMRYIVIHLPYQEVKHIPDARPLMLQLAKERLGLVAGSSLN